jgi:hypothetical protein
MKSSGIIRTAEGGWSPKLDYRINQKRIDEVDAYKSRYKAYVTAAMGHFNSILQSWQTRLDAKMLTNLAEVEYHRLLEGCSDTGLKHTSRERHEAVQINNKPLTIMELISKDPLRSLPLTSGLCEHFADHRGRASVTIVAGSPTNVNTLLS